MIQGKQVQELAAGAAAHMSANNSSTQSIPDTTVTPIVGWTVIQASAAFDPTTVVYTVPADGFYQINAQIGFNPGVLTLPGATGLAVLIERSTDDGGTWGTIAQGQVVFQAAANTPGFPNVAIGYPLDAGDLIRVSARNESGGDTLTLFPINIVNLFSVSLAL